MLRRLLCWVLGHDFQTTYITMPGGHIPEWGMTVPEETWEGRWCVRCGQQP